MYTAKLHKVELKWKIRNQAPIFRCDGDVILASWFLDPREPNCCLNSLLRPSKPKLHISGPMFMMTSSNGKIFRVTGHLCGEFTGPRFDVFFDLRLNKRLSKQSWGWWFETLSRPFWRHRNVEKISMPWRLNEPYFAAQELLPWELTKT